MSSARQEAARATYERAAKARDIRNEIVTPHALQEGDWVLVRHEKPQKFESKWFGPYQITQRMLLGTYRLQDPNGRELLALVHGNRLIHAHIRMMDDLLRLWASLAIKDALWRWNIQTELIPSDPEQTNLLEQYLLGIDEEEPDPHPVHIQHTASGSGDHTDETHVLLHIPQKRWLEQIALTELGAKRQRTGG